MQKAKKLRELFESEKVTRIVGAHDGLSAKLIEANGFDGIWASGLEISTSHAVPDANILTMSEYLERACEMNNAVNIPIVADCDTGYGNANNVIHMVKKYEAAGIAGVCIEDKLFPKVNSFVPGRQELASISEFVGKIMAAKNAQSTEDFMVIARIEALIAGWGMEEALKRAKAYTEAGADAILIHSKEETPSEVKEFCQKWDAQSPIVIVPTTYPSFHVNQMSEFGIKMVIYANHGIRASIKAMNDVLGKIKESGDLLGIDGDICTMANVFDLQGMTQMKKTEKEYLKTDKKSVTAIIPAAGDPSYEESMKDIVQDCPIAMLDINGKPILKRNVEVLKELKIDDIRVVTGFNAGKFDVGDVSYVENKSFQETSQADSIILAANDVNNGVLVAFSDILFEKELVQKLLESGEDIALSIDGMISANASRIDYVKAEKEPVRASRRISSRRTNKILRIGREFIKDDANFEFIGLSYFSKKGLELFKSYYNKFKEEGSKSQIDFLDLIQRMVDDGITVAGVEVNGGWIEIRNLENYKVAHTIF